MGACSTPSPVTTIKNGPRLYQMFPWGNITPHYPWHPQLRTIARGGLSGPFHWGICNIRLWPLPLGYSYSLEKTLPPSCPRGSCTAATVPGGECREQRRGLNFLARVLTSCPPIQGTLCVLPFPDTNYPCLLSGLGEC